MLLRNLSPPSLINGTKLLLKVLKDNLNVATILTALGNDLHWLAEMFQKVPVSGENFICSDD